MNLFGGTRLGQHGAIAFLLFAGLAAAPPAHGDTNVTIGNNYFDPGVAYVLIGDSVTWTNVEGIHNVVADSSIFVSGSPTLAPWTFSFPFEITGTFDYYCSPHGGPGGSGQAGTIQVMRALFADGFEGGSEGEWAALVPAGDTCAATIPITHGMNVAGTLAGAQNNIDSGFHVSCFGDAIHGRDRMYGFLQSSGQTLSVIVTPTSPGFDPVVYIVPFGNCSFPTQCLDASDLFGPGLAETVSYTHSGAPTAVVVIVDTLEPATAGSTYTFQASVSP